MIRVFGIAIYIGAAITLGVVAASVAFAAALGMVFLLERMLDVGCFVCSSGGHAIMTLALTTPAFVMGVLLGLWEEDLRFRVGALIVAGLAQAFLLWNFYASSSGSAPAGIPLRGWLDIFAVAVFSVVGALLAIKSKRARRRSADARVRGSG